MSASTSLLDKYSSVSIGGANQLAQWHTTIYVFALKIMEYPFRLNEKNNNEVCMTKHGTILRASKVLILTFQCYLNEAQKEEE